MIIRTTMYKKDEITEEMKKELEEAAKYPIVYDEDSPKMTPKMREALRVAVKERNRRNAEKRKAI